ncbi:MAG TPA: formate/nitrite transporter family protein [Planctomycetota bacterium]|nr:formate/nitrite transporter family protein [Planctomycetota bacterium]
MDYTKPTQTVEAMIDLGAAKAALGPRELLIRGILSGAILAISTTLAILATIQTGTPLVGALLFPVGFVMIILGGLELLTGNFAVVPVGVLDGRARMTQLASNFAWVFVGNLIGSVAYGLLFYYIVPQTGATAGVAEKLIAAAQAKTTGYQALGSRGMIAVFVKAVLCNWMVTLGVVMGLTSSSTVGKVLAAWLPIFIFFAHGYEHLIVNFFVIPTGMMLGAKVTIAQWIVWNLLPVTLGNFLGGFVLTGLAFYLGFPKRALAKPPVPARNPEPVSAGALEPS